MRKLKSLWALMALPMMLASCSNDDPVPGNEGGTGTQNEGVYMSLNITPYNKAGGRSQTTTGNQSSDGTEVGTDEENAIKTALIVLTDRENHLIGSALTPSADGKGTITAGTADSNPQYMTVAKFDKTELADYYRAYTSSNNPYSGNVGEVNVFVFCNPTNEFLVQMETAEAGTADWTEFVANVSGDALWSVENGFMMSNVSIAKRELPTTINAWDFYNKEQNPFKLSGSNGSSGSVDAIDNSTTNERGPVKVHRMAARFDFRDGSQMKDDKHPEWNGIYGTPFTYSVVTNAEGKYIVNCEIIAMALTNMSTTQYYLGRVSDNGLLSGSNYQLCGYEDLNNYVVSTNAQAKFNEIKTDFSNYFIYPFFSPNGLVYEKGEGWDWHQCSDVIKGASDNYNDKSYHVWRYVAENTIPGPPTKQINSQSTGVVFKARMLPTDELNDEGSDKWEKLLYKALAYESTDADLTHNADTDPIIYSLVGKLAGNSLFVTWENVREAAMVAAGFDDTKSPEEQSLDRNAPLYHLIFGNGGAGEYKYMYHTREFTDDTQTDVTDKYTEATFKDLDKDPTAVNTLWELWEAQRKVNPDSDAAIAAKNNFRKAATEKGFTLYQSSEDPATHKWGYYCYYYYWNRHNDNNLPGTMGPMEFAVVRNNVYKLAVTSLKTLGHPRIPANDPDDPKPDTPDEKSEVYISVSVEIVPWVVRINHIDF